VEARPGLHLRRLTVEDAHDIVVFPNLADAVDVQRRDQLCETTSALVARIWVCIVLLTKTGPRCISFRCKVTVSLAQGAVNDAEADVADPVFVRSTINKIPLPWRSIGRLLKESVSSRPIKRRYHAGLQPTLDCLRACPACKPSISAMTTVGSRDAQSTEWLKQLREHRGQAALAKSDLLGEVRGRA